MKRCKACGFSEDDPIIDEQELVNKIRQQVMDDIEKKLMDTFETKKNKPHLKNAPHIVFDGGYGSKEGDATAYKKQ
jgi:hypothetical protein